MSRQARSGLSSARVNRAVIQAAPKTPSGLPITSPTSTPMAIGLLSASKNPVLRRSTPEAKKAKSGTQSPALIG